MNESRAIAAVEETYSSLEDFTLYVLSECPEVLEDDLPIAKIADLVNLDPGVAHFVLTRSTRFRMMVRSDLVNREFTLGAESRHIKEVVGIAKNDGVMRMTAKGDIVSVDHQPADIMAAGKYLNDYRGTSLQQEKSRITLGVQVNFIGIGDEDGPTIDVQAVESDTERQELPHHRPARAGDLPPPDARQRYALSDGKPQRSQRRTGGELDFYSPAADEEARDSELEARTRQFVEGERADNYGAEGPVGHKSKWPTRERLSAKINRTKSSTSEGVD